MPIGEFLENPYIQLGMNILGNMNYSDRPQTLAGGIGQAFQQTLQQARQRKVLEMEKQQHDLAAKRQDLEFKKFDALLKEEEKKAKIGEKLTTIDLSPESLERLGGQALASGVSDLGIKLLEMAQQARKDSKGPEKPAEVRTAEWYAGLDPNGPLANAYRETQKGKGTRIEMGEGFKVGPIAENHMVTRDPQTGELTMEPIKGAPVKPESYETSGKVAGSEIAAENMQKLRSLLFDEKGEPNRKVLAESALKINQGRTMKTLMRGIIEQKIVATTGLTATDQQMQAIEDAYMPGPLDTKENIEEKLNQLASFNEGTLRNFAKGRPQFKSLMDALNTQKPTGGETIRSPRKQYPAWFDPSRFEVIQ